MSSRSSSASNIMSKWFTPKRIRVLQKMAFGIGTSTVPVLIWWNWSTQQRRTREEDVRTRVRVPNVQTMDDLMIEQCRPGDILLFDRRWEHCSSGPTAALVCLLGRRFLCFDDPNKIVQEGKFDHCGIVVPGYAKNTAEELDASNLLLLEATAGGGIVARPLRTRLEMSQSRQVLLVPLALPNERRNDQFSSSEVSPGVEATEQLLRKKLQEFRDKWVDLSKEKQYVRAHNTLGLMGALAYALGYHTRNAGPTSPCAWFVTLALNEAHAGQNVSDRTMKEAKVEDFLRDYRFQDQNVIRLRPGWRFLPPISFRAT